MNKFIPKYRPTAALLATAVCTLLAWVAVGEPTPPAQPPKPVVIEERAVKPGGNVTSDAPTPNRKVFRIESIERDPGRAPAPEVTWLGVYTEEASEVLSAQLNLKPGAGLVISYVAENSPAAKAGLQKNDVLVELGDQLLVHPAQLSKLIRSQKDGDPVKLTLYRRGSQQTVSATLGKRAGELGMSPGPAEWNFVSGNTLPGADDDQMKALHESLLRAGDDRQKMMLEVERRVEETRKALQDALRHPSHDGSALGADAKDLEALAQGGVDLPQDATVVVKRAGSSVKTIVKADETGTCIIVASPRKHLTAHDKDGKLLFDGEIESDEQQQKVPAAVWEKVKPMLPEMTPPADAPVKPHADLRDDIKT
jgi:hypothetical protein